jgi:molybdenum cofactor guanylyltransferase
MNDRITTLILAGGRSSRMGQDKACLRLGDNSILENLLETAFQISGHAVIMRAPEQQSLSISWEHRDKITIGFDKIEGEGPLQGIADSLTHIPQQTDRIFVITCDLPFLSTLWLNTLNNALTEEWDAVCTHADNITNALLAIYRPQVLKIAPKILLEGKRRPVDLLEGWRVKKLPPMNVFPIEVKDMNTPLEYEKVKLQFLKSND